MASAEDEAELKRLQGLLPPPKVDPYPTPAPAATAPKSVATREFPQPTAPQSFTDTGSDLNPLLRKGGIALDQYGVGIGQFIDDAVKIPFKLGDKISPGFMDRYMPEQLRGPNSAARFSEPSLQPADWKERELAATARGAGYMTPAAVVFRNPGIAVAGGTTGAVTQGVREAGGSENLAQGVGLLTGVATMPFGASLTTPLGIAEREAGYVRGIRAGDVLHDIGAYASPIWGVAGRVIGSYGGAALNRLRNASWTGIARQLLMAPGAGVGVAETNPGTPGGKATVDPRSMIPPAIGNLQ